MIYIYIYIYYWKSEMEVREAREAVEAGSRDVSELQSNLAWNTSRVDEQSAQLRILKQQPLAFEEEVPTADADAGATQQALRVHTRLGTDLLTSPSLPARSMMSHHSFRLSIKHWVQSWKV
jgi:hypothetical protein